MKILILTTDAYGCHGGIALYNRDIIDALAEMQETESITLIPRNYSFTTTIPSKVNIVSSASKGKLRYVFSTLCSIKNHYDLIICGHINLLPIAELIAGLKGLPLVLLIYGIDAWTRPSSPLALLTLRLKKVSAVWSISEATKRRMIDWSGFPSEKCAILPNAVHLSHYSACDPDPVLQRRYGLEGKKVLLTLGRLSKAERYKGVDEVLEALPSLIKKEPALKYLIAGDGDDRQRLEQKACDLELRSHTVFAGFIVEEEKADHFRLADVYIMPSRGEGFGFVFLEAMACGIPTIGSILDGSKEALRNGELGLLVDPSDTNAIQNAILKSLSMPRSVPQGLQYFAWPAFKERLYASLQNVLKS